MDVMKYALIGVDGSKWPLTSPTGFVHLATTPTGILGGPMQHDYQEVVDMDGALYRGTQHFKAQSELDVWVKRLDTPARTRAEHARFMRALGDGTRQAHFCVVSKNGGWRRLPVRLGGVSEPQWPGSGAGRVGEVLQKIILVADSPWWRHLPDSVQRVKVPAGGEVTIPIRNDGDRPVWPVLSWENRSGRVTVTVGGQALAFPARISPYRVDTDPLWPTITTEVGGAVVDLTESLPGVRFRSPMVDGGAVSEVRVQTETAGDVYFTIEWIPLSRFAW